MRMHCLAGETSLQRASSLPRIELEFLDEENGTSIAELPETFNNIDQNHYQEGTLPRNRKYTVYRRYHGSMRSYAASPHGTVNRSHADTLPQGGCLPCVGQFGLLQPIRAQDERRQPITALAAQGFWNGISELKEVLTPGNPLLDNSGKVTSVFYIEDLRKRRKRVRFTDKSSKHCHIA